jgi:integrase
MRKRYQQGSVTKSSDGRYWIGKYREGGRHKTKVLGKIREITKSRAQQKLAEIVKPLNGREIPDEVTLKTFIEGTYFPFYQRKWKGSTLMTNKDRIRRHIIAEFGRRQVRAFTRDELQGFLDSKSKLSFSTVAHLRWDLKQIFGMAVAEGLIVRNPAAMLFVPRHCSKPHHRTMTVDEVKLALTVLDLRERVVFKLAVFAGLRPGEIFALRRTQLTEKTVDIRERIYRGQLDTPKTRKSIRTVALSKIVREDLEELLATSPTVAEAWLFPSENADKPLVRDNVLYRHMRPRLETVGLEWVNYQVMRRTHSSLMRELGVDPKIVADHMGHDVDVNLNVYTQTSLDSRIEAVNTLEAAFVN